MLQGSYSYRRDQTERTRALRILELLLAAGYAPSVYHGVPLPSFLRLSEAVACSGEASATARTVDRLDPFDYLTVGPQMWQVEERCVAGLWLHRLCYFCIVRMVRCCSTPASALPILLSQAGVPCQGRQLGPRLQPPVA